MYTLTSVSRLAFCKESVSVKSIYCSISIDFTFLGNSKSSSSVKLEGFMFALFIFPFDGLIGSCFFDGLYLGGAFIIGAGN